jgi:regulatory protein
MPDTVIELKPRPRGRVTVKLAGGRFFTIPQDAVTFSVAAVVSDEDVSRFDRMDQYFRGKDKAYFLISRRMRTRKQVADALDKLAIEASIRNGILTEFEETGLIDDLRFASEYVRIKRDVRRHGPYRLRHDLGRMGVRKSIVESVLEETFDAPTQESMARELAETRAAGCPVDEKAARRIGDFLRRRGFDYEVVNNVVYDLLHHSNVSDNDYES